MVHCEAKHRPFIESGKNGSAAQSAEFAQISAVPELFPLLHHASLATPRASRQVPQSVRLPRLRVQHRGTRRRLTVPTAVLAPVAPPVPTVTTPRFHTSIPNSSILTATFRRTTFPRSAPDPIRLCLTYLFPSLRAVPPAGKDNTDQGRRQDIEHSLRSRRDICRQP